MQKFVVYRHTSQLLTRPLGIQTVVRAQARSLPVKLRERDSNPSGKPVLHAPKLALQCRIGMDTEARNRTVHLCLNVRQTCLQAWR